MNTPLDPAILQSLITELIKLVITGFLGGLIGSWVGRRTFKFQTKFQTQHQDRLRRRDTLREIYAILPVISMRTYHGWSFSENEADEGRKLMERLNQQIEATKAVFIGDSQMMPALNTLKSLVGAEADRLSKSGVEPPLKTIKNIEQLITDKIQEIQSTLYRE